MSIEMRQRQLSISMLFQRATITLRKRFILISRLLTIMLTQSRQRSLKKRKRTGTMKPKNSRRSARRQDAFKFINNLTKDRNLRLQLIDLDKEYAENFAAKLQEEEDEYVRDHVHQIMNPSSIGQIVQTEDSQSVGGAEKVNSRATTPALPMSSHPYARMDEEQREMYQKAVRLRYQAQQFHSFDIFKQGFKIFREFTVIKFPRVWQSLFYLLRTDKEDICEIGTNKMIWKIAKGQITPEINLIQRMQAYEAMGQKTDVYKAYTTLNFVDRNIEVIYPEDVDAYSVSILGRLIRWVIAASKLRHHDIIRRKALQKKAKEQREDAIQREIKRQDRLKIETAEAETKFNEEHKEEIEAAALWSQREPIGEDENEEERPVMPVFHKEEFMNKWIAENPVIEIPEEIVDDIDNLYNSINTPSQLLNNLNDWELSQQESEYHLNAYHSKEQ